MNIDNQYKGKLMDIEKASEYLGIKPQALRRIFYTTTDQKEPVPTRIGHRVFFTPESLDKFVEKHTEMPDVKES